MWKQARKSGVSLAELLVVLAITVVLAAILMPAINTPTQAAKEEITLDPYVVAADGQWGGGARDRRDRFDELAVEAPVTDESGSREVVVEVMPAFDAGEVLTLERDGLKEIRTTDISYKLP